MSFLGGLIAANMEDPKERAWQAAHSREQVQLRANALLEQRSKPNKAPGYWKSDGLLDASKRDWALSGEDGKGSKYLAGPTTKANSYEGVLGIYKEAAAEDKEE